jgi:diadenosine tetraphosphatase ApaH/serine/threonine PP2A family protein phosphatase
LLTALVTPLDSALIDEIEMIRRMRACKIAHIGLEGQRAPAAREAGRR